MMCGHEPPVFANLIQHSLAGVHATSPSKFPEAVIAGSPIEAGTSPRRPMVASPPPPSENRPLAKPVKLAGSLRGRRFVSVDMENLQERNSGFRPVIAQTYHSVDMFQSADSSNATQLRESVNSSASSKPHKQKWQFLRSNWKEYVGTPAGKSNQARKRWKSVFTATKEQMVKDHAGYDDSGTSPMDYTVMMLGGPNTKPGRVAALRERVQASQNESVVTEQRAVEAKLVPPATRKAPAESAATKTAFVRASPAASGALAASARKPAAEPQQHLNMSVGTMNSISPRLMSSLRKREMRERQDQAATSGELNWVNAAETVIPLLNLCQSQSASERNDAIVAVHALCMNPRNAMQVCGFQPRGCTVIAWYTF